MKVMFSHFTKCALGLAAFLPLGAAFGAAAGSAGAVTPSFTAEQAASGKAAYAANCAVCHGAHLEGISAPALSGSDTNLKRESARETFAYVSTEMPVGNAGGLPGPVYVDILAYLLESNGRASGGGTLTAAALKASGDKIGAR